MTLMDILTIAGVGIGIVGLAYAFYQGTERRKLERFVRSQAWYTYAKANNVTGIIQHALEKYKGKHLGDFDPEILELLAKSDAFGQDLFKETIRQIQLAEPKFNVTLINQWIAEGKLDDGHKPLFLQLAIEHSTRHPSS